MDNSLWLNNFLNMYQELGTDNFDVLRTVYHSDVEFQDPLHHVSGIDALTRYFENIYTQVTSCNFHIDHAFEANNEASIYWTMQFSHKQLNGQKSIEVQGHSHLKMLDDQVFYHRDYLDVGAMLYEHIPVLGCAIKSIKKRASR
ncbi:nuclear transport factor 2 family protein [Vibrio cyclitrophicus]|uniref:nuclear transport factor 2 family protein n=1 Tax=Vibrio cyclitrophicus TaxID=47951 RepID=UPI000C8362E4|nr:nuclear transport factor 2 family protein [Vibrio cyclitrophicus]PME23428.1 transcriptional regulator [Vibrio cyclitrophicus]